MNADQLLQHFERISEAPEAIPRLRRFILDLAVRGKLVEQDPSEEPAAELLKRIAVEKARLVKAGEIKTRNISARNSADAISYKCPIGWVLSDLGKLSLKITDGAHKTPTYIGKGIPFISVKDFSGGKLNLLNTRFIPPDEHQVLYQRCDPRRGDILIARIGTLGKAVLVDTDVEFSLFVSVGLIRFDHKSLNPEFFLLLLNSPLVKAEFDRIKVGGGTHTNKLNLGDLHSVSLPLPPLAEQHRIVAKVDELMSLCDQLEAANVEREQCRDRLVAASLQGLNQPSEEEETFREHVRFTFKNLPRMTTRAAHIKQLRQTILNLAVRGKLVPQDPSDEPAAELLKRIAEEKAGSRKPTSTKNIAKPSEGDGFDAQIVMPVGWVWASLDAITHVGTGLTPLKAQLSYYEGGTVPWINSSATSDDVIREAKFFVTQLAVKECRLKIYPAGSLLVALYGQGKTRGQVSELGLDATVNQACAVVQWLPSFHEIKDFIRLTLEQQYDAMRERAEGGPQPNLNVGKIKNRIFPFPPLAEQHRIVAKVEELMGICDQLEAQITVMEKDSLRFLEAVLHQAVGPAKAVMA